MVPFHKRCLCYGDFKSIYGRLGCPTCGIYTMFPSEDTIYVAHSCHLFFVAAKEQLQMSIHESVFVPSMPSSQPAKELPICWDRNIKLLPGIADIKFKEVPEWNFSQVVGFIQKIIPDVTEDNMQSFIEQVCDITEIRSMSRFTRTFCSWKHAQYYIMYCTCFQEHVTIRC